MAVEFHERDGYLEVWGTGDLTAEEWIPPEQMPFPPGTRLLIDYSQVRKIEVGLDVFVHAVRVMAQLQYKVALFATLDIMFGVGRQTILSAGLPEGEQFSVFRTKEEAIAWLMAPTAPPDVCRHA